MINLVGIMLGWSILGLVAISLSLIKPLWNWYRRLYLKPFRFITQDGTFWAVITGPTDGIGFEFARQLALKGYNLMLISRNQAKLEQTIEMIRDECRQKKKRIVEMEYLVLDFGDSKTYHFDVNQPQKNFKLLLNFLNQKQRDIFILINNVGFGSGTKTYFNEETPEMHQQALNVNLMSGVRMLELVLPKMIEKRRGLVINMSSISSNFPMPRIAIYAAAKAFVNQLSRSLYEECREHNVLVYLFYPAIVSTKMTDYVSPGFLIPSPQELVESALKSIYWNKMDSCAHWGHATLQTIMQWIEFFTSKRTMARITHSFWNLYMEKLEKIGRFNEDGQPKQLEKKFEITFETYLRTFAKALFFPNQHISRT